MYELWKTYIISTNYSATVSNIINSKQSRTPPDTTNTTPESRYYHLLMLYAAINTLTVNNESQTLTTRKANVKANFKAYIETQKPRNSTNTLNDAVMNDAVMNYTWEVICLWLLEFAMSHKSCNQRKSQYNLMTFQGRNAAKNRTYTSGNVIDGRKVTENAFNERLGQKSIVCSHLESIYNQYKAACNSYVFVSSGTMFNVSDNDMSKSLKDAVVRKSHIWDNLRRMVRYVSALKDEYDKMAKEHCSKQQPKRKGRSSSDGPTKRRRIGAVGGAARRTRRRRVSRKRRFVSRDRTRKRRGRGRVSRRKRRV